MSSGNLLLVSGHQTSADANQTGDTFMKTILKTIAVSALIAGMASAGVMSAAQATPYGGPYGPYSDVFQGD